LPLVDFIQNKVYNQEDIRLNLICTHNSRRSHLSQVWAQSGILQHKNVFSYSGGTEATALYPMAAQTLEQSGFKIRVIAAGNNPIYSIKYAENTHPVISSKKIRRLIQKSEFAAL
jgi:arsenate reductase